MCTYTNVLNYSSDIFQTDIFNNIWIVGAYNFILGIKHII
jgi:hypothetical protein